MKDRSARGRWSFLGWTAVGAAGVIVAAVCVVGWSRTPAASEDPAPRPKKDVHVMVLKDGDDPEVHVYNDDDEGDHEKSRGGYLGVSIEEDTKNSEGGARVETVAEGSPADKAGIKRGDTIVGFHGDVIRGPARLTEKIHASHPGDKVDVKLIRKDGGKETVTVELGERSKSHGYWYGFGEGDETPMPDLKGLDDLGDKLKKLHVFPRGRMWALRGDRPRLGVELVETTPELREHLGGSGEAGLLVGKVLSGTPAQKAGVKVGDLIVSVDGDRVSDSGDLIEILSDKEGKTIDLELVRDRKTTHVQVPIPKQEEDEDAPRGPRALAPPPPVPPPALPRRRVAGPRPRDGEDQLRAAEALLQAQEQVLRNVERKLQRTLADKVRVREEVVRRVHEEIRRAMDRAQEAMRRARIESVRAGRIAAQRI